MFIEEFPTVVDRQPLRLRFALAQQTVLQQRYAAWVHNLTCLPSDDPYFRLKGEAVECPPDASEADIERALHYLVTTDLAQHASDRKATNSDSPPWEIDDVIIGEAQTDFCTRQDNAILDEVQRVKSNIAWVYEMRKNRFDPRFDMDDPEQTELPTTTSYEEKRRRD